MSINKVVPHARHGHRNPSHRLIVNISNNDEAIILWLLTSMGGTIASQLARHARAYNHRWVVQGSNALAFLRAIHPYVRIKKERVALGIAFLELTTTRTTHARGRSGALPISADEIGRREAMRRQMLALNDRHVHRIGA